MDKQDRSLDEIFGGYLGGDGSEGKAPRAPYKFLDPDEAKDGRQPTPKDLSRASAPGSHC